MLDLSARNWAVITRSPAASVPVDFRLARRVVLYTSRDSTSTIGRSRFSARRASCNAGISPVAITLIRISPLTGATPCRKLM